MDAKDGLTGVELGCFTVIMIAGAIFLGFGWFLGEFLLAPVHCRGPVCEAWALELRLSTVSSFVGMGVVGWPPRSRCPGSFSHSERASWYLQPWQALGTQARSSWLVSTSC